MPLPEEYKVHIGVFDGPMDLLLYVVQKNEVRPEAISIAEIAEQYFAWMKDLSQADLSAAGDFLLMASRLMELKVRELLPRDEQTPEEEQEFDADREAFIKQIYEYQRYKQVARELQEMEEANFGAFYRGRPEKLFSDEETLADANIWQLFRAYQKSLRTGTIEHIHHIELDYVTIEDRQQAISNYLAVHGRALFDELLGNDPHPILATVTFMALMEMIKTDEVVFRQGEPLGPIWIYRKKNNAQYADEMAMETYYQSPDPEFKPGLLEILRNRESVQANQKAATIDAVMREAVLWATSGRIVHEDDLIAMLEGRLAISNASLNDEQPADPNDPNAPKQVDITQIIEQSKAEPTAASDMQQGEMQLEAETAPSENTESAVPADNGISEPVSSESTSETAEISPDQENSLAEDLSAAQNAVDDALTEIKLTESALEESFDDPAEELASEESPIDETAVEESEKEKPAEPAGLNPNMTEEEIAEFIRRAQEFYNSDN